VIRRLDDGPDDDLESLRTCAVSRQGPGRASEAARRALLGQRPRRGNGEAPASGVAQVQCARIYIVKLALLSNSFGPSRARDDNAEVAGKKLRRKMHKTGEARIAQLHGLVHDQFTAKLGSAEITIVDLTTESRSRRGSSLHEPSAFRDDPGRRRRPCGNFFGRYRRAQSVAALVPFNRSTRRINRCGARCW
jgi:hypothetical protein